VTANRVERAAGAKNERRRPLALIIVPIVLVAALAVLLLLLHGGETGIPILGQVPDDTVPPFDLKVTKSVAISTDPLADVEVLKATAAEIGAEITPTIDDLFTNAFLDPSNWRNGDYAEVIAAFDPGAASAAEQSLETLTLGTGAGEVYDSVRPGKSTVSYRVLFDPDGKADTVVAIFTFTATGHRKDGTDVAISSKGQLFLKDIDGWKITAFKVARKDRELEPASPAVSAPATPSA
jgi:hypothetical protein